MSNTRLDTSPSSFSKSPSCHVLPTPLGNRQGLKPVISLSRCSALIGEKSMSRNVRAAIYARISEDPRAQIRTVVVRGRFVAPSLGRRAGDLPCGEWVRDDY